MDAQVFISFASQDDKVAKTLCTALESRGFKCWISSRDILPGENFQIAIVRAIRTVKMMLLVFTANSNNSEEMNKELALASQSKLAVVPLRIDDVTPNDAFRYEFATRQWVDFFSDWELAMNQLTAQIAHIAGAPALPIAPPPPPPAPLPTSAPLAAPTLAPSSGPIVVGPTSYPATQDLAGSRGKGAPVALFVAFGVVIVLLLGGVLALQIFGGKPAAPVAVAPQTPADSATPAVAIVPPTVTILPQAPPPAAHAETPSAAPSQPTVAEAPPAIAVPQPPSPPTMAKTHVAAAPQPRPPRPHPRASQQAVDEGDAAPARRSHVPDEGDEAPH